MGTMLYGIDKEMNLVDGLKLRVKSSELAEHCRARAKYHRQRAE